MSGTVYLVGAGPGDPGLITRRALDLIAEADVILYDRLIPSGALDGARPDADLRYVGKRPGEPTVSQEEINRSLIELARAGESVVRLKGGDPFVFGRGGERLRLLPTTPEHERVAALQPHHGAPGSRELHERAVDLLLRHGRLAGTLPHVPQLRVGPRPLEHTRRHKTVVQDRVGLGDQVERAPGDQAGIAGTCADQVHRPGHRTEH